MLYFNGEGNLQLKIIAEIGVAKMRDDILVMLGIHKDHFYAYWLEPKVKIFNFGTYEIYYVVSKFKNINL